MGFSFFLFLFVLQFFSTFFCKRKRVLKVSLSHRCWVQDAGGQEDVVSVPLQHRAPESGTVLSCWEKCSMEQGGKRVVVVVEVEEEEEVEEGGGGDLAPGP